MFLNTHITAPGDPTQTTVWLGRPWHNRPKTVFINTVTEVNIPNEGWYETMGGIPILWADYNTTDPMGKKLDLSQRRTEYYSVDSNGHRLEGKAKNFLTDEEAANYRVENILGDWHPIDLELVK